MSPRRRSRTWSRAEAYADPRVARAIDAIRENQDVDDPRDVPEVRLMNLDERTLRFVIGESQRHAYDPNLFDRAMDKIAQGLFLPLRTNNAKEISLALEQPEVRQLFAEWQLRKPAGGFEANTLASRAIAVLMAGWLSPHILAVFRDLDGREQLIRAFLEIEQSLVDPASAWVVREYTTVTRHLIRLSEIILWPALVANIELMKRLHVQYPDVARYGAIDGQASRAWRKQTSKGKTPEEEAARRGHTPHAGARVYVYDRRGKREPGVDELFRHTVILKQWRGYILAALVDLFSGRPLVWKLIDASWDEAKVLKDLLHMLYTLWPDCPLEVVVGDAAYDEAWAYEWCETGYGVHLVAPRKPSLEKTQRTLHDLEAIGILKIDGLGRAVCRAHGQPLVRQSFHQGSRIGLRPGEVSQVSEFRHRLSCSHGCERLSLPASLNWSAITYYPHHSDIHPKRYAEKLAFLARRNVVESVYSGLKTMSLASSGPDRPQFRKMEEVAMLISLQFVTRTAQLVGVISAESGLRRAA